MAEGNSKIEKQVTRLSRFFDGMPSEEKQPLLDNLRLRLENGEKYKTIFHEVSPGSGNNTHCSGLEEGDRVGGGRYLTKSRR